MTHCCRHPACAAALVLLALLAGCAEPLPPTELDYVGLWRGEGVLLRITREGHLDYRRDSGASEVALSLPIREIADGAIVAGLPFWNTEIAVERPPARRDGRWSMVVEGRTLYRVDEGDAGAPGGGIEI